ncbi:MAG: VanZ family protein [bacterium]
MTSRLQKSLILLLFGSLGVLLLLPVPRFVDDHYLLGMLQNAGHAPGFAMLTCGFLYLVNARSRAAYVSVIGIVLVFAVASEVLQHFTHRQFSIADIASDFVGVSFGFLVWLLCVDRRVRRDPWLRRLSATGAAAALLLMLAPPLMGISIWLDRHAKFPVLLEPAMADVLSMTGSLGKRDEVEITLHADRVSIDLLAGPRPGLVIKDFVSDWQGFDTLVIEVGKFDEGDLLLELYVRDAASAPAGSDWFFAHAMIESEGWHQLRFALDDIKNGPQGRLADLRHISSIGLHRREGTAARFSIRKIYLR